MPIGEPRDVMPVLRYDLLAGDVDDSEDVPSLAEVITEAYAWCMGTARRSRNCGGGRLAKRKQAHCHVPPARSRLRPADAILGVLVRVL